MLHHVRQFEVLEEDFEELVARKHEGEVVLGDHAPEVCQAGTPLTYSNFKIWKVPSGGTFNLQSRPTTGYYLRSVTNGVISSNPY